MSSAPPHAASPPGTMQALEARAVLAPPRAGQRSQAARRAAGERVRVAGVVTHRQRPGTAAGTVFLNLEDETGLLNVVCSAGLWKRYRRVGRRASALIVRGRVESSDAAASLIADRLEALEGIETAGSRDWC